MGISGLLVALKGCTTTRHVRDYKGVRVAIDGYSWLHKGAYSCSRALCEGAYTDKCACACPMIVRWCMTASLTQTGLSDIACKESRCCFTMASCPSSFSTADGCHRRRMRRNQEGGERSYPPNDLVHKFLSHSDHPNPDSSRDENRAKAMAHLAAGNTAAAEECFQRAVNVTAAMAKQLIEVRRRWL